MALSRLEVVGRQYSLLCILESVTSVLMVNIYGCKGELN
jgi:hypothetical protein